jgi:hypothetical protein
LNLATTKKLPHAIDRHVGDRVRMRGQAENLTKLHKAQLSSDRMSCHSATANQVRLALHTAAY